MLRLRWWFITLEALLISVALYCFQPEGWRGFLGLIPLVALMLACWMEGYTDGE